LAIVAMIAKREGTLSAFGSKIEEIFSMSEKFIYSNNRFFFRAPLFSGLVI
jgi:hypothetical protein